MLKVSLAELLLKIYVEVIIDENTDKIAEKTEQTNTELKVRDRLKSWNTSVIYLYEFIH